MPALIPVPVLDKFKRLAMALPVGGKGGPEIEIIQARRVCGLACPLAQSFLGRDR
jgi:hypothetical protein